MEKLQPEGLFVGREYELRRLEEEVGKPRASLVVLYGRRRIGKTRLITEFHRHKRFWRFDGVEGKPKSFQIQHVLDQLADYTGKSLYRSVRCKTWIELLKVLDQAIQENQPNDAFAVFLDELPYLANRQHELIAALKWIWDNQWQDRKNFTLILCGSIASFMVQKVVRSSALYGRVTLEICLDALSVPEVHLFFKRKKAIREICDLYMVCGGVPEYLKQIDPGESVVHNVANLGFLKDGYFVHEFDRLFKDIFREEMIYKRVIRALSQYRSLKVPELARLLKISSGGGLVDLLENLELAGLIKKITPWEKPEESKLKRYQLSDEYLLFYFRFILPHLKRIQKNTQLDYGLSLLQSRTYPVWAGFAFERLCLKHTEYIMKYLKIDQLVKNDGAYFDRKTNLKGGVQIDLMFDRHDPVLTVCEMKYHRGLIGKWIIPEMERKIGILKETKKTIERVLITTEGITRDLREANYFSKVILIEDLFK